MIHDNFVYLHDFNCMFFYDRYKTECVHILFSFAGIYWLCQTMGLYLCVRVSVVRHAGIQGRQLLLFWMQADCLATCQQAHWKKYWVRSQCQGMLIQALTSCLWVCLSKCTSQCPLDSSFRMNTSHTPPQGCFRPKINVTVINVLLIVLCIL